MGMAYQAPYVKPKPKAPYLLVCDNRYCHAQWKPADKEMAWYRVSYKGTDDRPIYHYKIDDDRCPCCGTKVVKEEKANADD